MRSKNYRKRSKRCQTDNNPESCSVAYIPCSNVCSVQLPTEKFWPFDGGVVSYFGVVWVHDNITFFRYRVLCNARKFQLFDPSALFLLFSHLLLHSVGSKVWFPFFFEMGLLFKCKCAKQLCFFFLKGAGHDTRECVKNTSAVNTFLFIYAIN